jgi:hypothetical protein
MQILYCVSVLILGQSCSAIGWYEPQHRKLSGQPKLRRTPSAELSRAFQEEERLQLQLVSPHSPGVSQYRPEKLSRCKQNYY